MKVYGLRNCDTCRKAIRPCRGGARRGSGGCPRDAAGRCHAGAVPEAFGAKLVNTRSTTWRGLSEAERAHCRRRTLLAAHPAVMKRPVIESGRWGALPGLGRDGEVVASVAPDRIASSDSGPRAAQHQHQQQEDPERALIDDDVAGVLLNQAPMVSGPTPWPTMSTQVWTMTKPIMPSAAMRVNRPRTISAGRMNSAHVPKSTIGVASGPRARGRSPPHRRRGAGSGYRRRDRG
jgi:arsenate reductase